MYEFLANNLDRIDEMTPAQRAILAIGVVHLSCQREGVYLTLHNVDPRTVLGAIDAADPIFPLENGRRTEPSCRSAPPAAATGRRLSAAE